MCFQSQRRGGPLSACRRPLAIRRRIAASRAARMIIAAQVVARDDEVIEQSGDFRSWAGTFQTLRDVRLEPGMRTKADVRPRLWIYWLHWRRQLSGLVNRAGFDL